MGPNMAQNPKKCYLLKSEIIQLWVLQVDKESESEVTGRCSKVSVFTVICVLHSGLLRGLFGVFAFSMLDLIM